VRTSAEDVYREMGNGLLVLTEGDGGAVVYSAQGVVSRPAYNVPNVVDTVGAGVTFQTSFQPQPERY
jgi:fructokinase